MINNNLCFFFFFNLQICVQPTGKITNLFLKQSISNATQLKESLPLSPAFDFSLFESSCRNKTVEGDDNTHCLSFDLNNENKNRDWQKFENDSHGNLLDDLQCVDNLPSPLEPVPSSHEDYHGFSSQGSNIPIISCNTGDSLCNSKSKK